ncbi:MAG TPA: GNAT family N-acetyltransferase [Pirellulales bacterium]|nr:GNAT family N-acetyltransferase [Pirellulales bacterium]
MTEALDVHPASPAELVAAHRNVFDIWSKGLPLDQHVHQRLESPSHGRASWYVGTVAGQVVTSLGCYPITFCVRGQLLPAIAIGSVYTMAEFRGRGFAPQLIQWVEQDQSARGAAWSVLYSDIEPQYYARRGYTLCPSWEGWTTPGAPASLLATGWRLKPLSPIDDLGAIAALYASYHGRWPLSFARDEDYWSMLFKKSSQDRFYGLQDPAGILQGYARITTKAGGIWRITDYALADDGARPAEQLYQALAAEAGASGASRIGGWLPNNDIARQCFQLAPRSAEITMLKPLAAQFALDPQLVAATSQFCEIDHV